MVVASPVIDTVLAVPPVPVTLLQVFAEKATEAPTVIVVSATKATTVQLVELEQLTLYVPAEGPPASEAKAAAAVAPFVPPSPTGSTPITPVVNGRPDALVSVALDGVPSAPPLKSRRAGAPVPIVSDQPDVPESK
jgi:hypothetical protein